MLSLAALKAPSYPQRSESLPPAGDKKGNLALAVVIPGHNEEKLISACVRSVLAAGIDTSKLLVIAHNCNDATAANASDAGATVLALDDDGSRGKGAALFYGFGQALARGAEAVLVVDADTVIAPLLVTQARLAFQQGADAVQARYIAAGEQANDRQRLLALGLYGFNVLRPRGRENLGLSCGIFGNGFGLSAATLQALPYTAHSLVEDLEYHLELVRSGRRVRFLDAAEVHGEVPDNRNAAGTQRARWEGGRSAMRRQFAGPLFREVLRGRVSLLEPLLDLLALPLGSALPLLVLALLLPVSWCRVAASVGLLAVVLYVMLSAWLSKQPVAMFRSLMSVPKYLVFKLLLRKRTRAAAQGQSSWERTERNE